MICVTQILFLPRILIKFYRKPKIPHLSATFDMFNKIAAIKLKTIKRYTKLVFSIGATFFDTVS